jgi:hypothetical protein
LFSGILISRRSEDSVKRHLCLALHSTSPPKFENSVDRPPNADVAGFLVDPDKQSQSINFSPSVFLSWEISDESNAQTVLAPFAVVVGDSITQHPSVSGFAVQFP